MSRAVRSPQRSTLRCARYCGRGCTQAEHDRAKSEARRLADRLGEGWTPDVWENLGWHHCAVSPYGRVKVHPSFGGAFVAFLGRAGEPGGVWAEEGRTPKRAVLAVLQAARDALAPYTDLLLPRMGAQ